jgi:hypothetical protein
MDIDAGALKSGVKLNLVGVAYREDGSVALRFGDTLEAPYHYSTQFNIAPGRYRLLMAVGANGGAFGKVERPIEIEPWTGRAISMSGIALGSEQRPLADLTTELDNSMLDGEWRLAAKGNVIVPMSGSQFGAGRDGFLYFEIYDMRQAASAPEARIRIVERTTGQAKSESEVNVQEWVRPGNPVIPIAWKLPVAGLPAGPYTVEVRVGDTVHGANFEVK